MRRGVLVTRPRPSAAETAARLTELGWQPVLAPLLRIETLEVAPPHAPIQAVLVTSANALPGLPQALRRVPLLAVGEATAATARGLGFRDARVGMGNAEQLAELAAGTLRPGAGPVLLAHGVGQGDALHGLLLGAGFDVIRATAYAAHPVTVLPEAAERALQSGALDSAVFLSAETARVFTRLVIGAGLAACCAELRGLALAAPIGQALAVLPWRELRVAGRPDQDALLALLQ